MIDLGGQPHHDRVAGDELVSQQATQHVRTGTRMLCHRGKGAGADTIHESCRLAGGAFDQWSEVHGSSLRG
jgi:hypothetical protein